MRSTQTHSHAKHSSSTQTCTQISDLSSNLSTSSSSLTSTKLDQVRKELDFFKLKLTKEQNDLNAQIDEKNLELKRLEDTIKHLLKQIEELNAKLSEHAIGSDLMQKNHDEQLAKLNGNFKIEKQISDTIIQQQKKLLYYLQMKLNGDSPVESSSDKGSDHHHHQHAHCSSNQQHGK